MASRLLFRSTPRHTLCERTRQQTPSAGGAWVGIGSIEQFPELFSIEFRVAQNPSQKPRADRFPGVNGHDRGAAVRVL